MDNNRDKSFIKLKIKINHIRIEVGRLQRTQGILIVFLLVFIFVFAGCSKKEEEFFKMTSSFYEEKSDFFDVETGEHMMLVVGEGKYYKLMYIKDSFDDEVVETIVSKIKFSLNQIHKKVGVLPKEEISIYVFPNNKMEGFASNGHKIFYSLSDLEEDNIYYKLVKGYVGVSNPGLNLGLVGYIKEKEYNRNVLKEHFSREENLNLLHLFGPRFMKDWNEEAEYEIAEITAIDLVKFVVNEKGIQFLKTIDESLKNEWLKAIGSPFTYKNSDIKYDDYTYVEKDNYVEVHTGDSKYSIEKTKYFSTAKEIEDLIITQIKWKQELKEYVKTHAPKYYHSNNWDNNIMYTIRARATDNEMSRAGINSIKLMETGAAIFHELGHILFPFQLPNNNLMKGEGIAEYVSLILCPYDIRMERYYNGLSKETEEEVLPFNEKVKEYYDKYLGGKESGIVSDIKDREFLVDAYVLASICGEYFPLDASLSVTINDKYGDGRNIEGGELSYLQSCSFISYLCNKYSFEKVLEFCTTRKSCEEAFWKTYDDLKKEWIQYLERYQ